MLLREIARRVQWDWDWGGRVAEWAAFEALLPSLLLLESLGLDWARRLPTSAETPRQRLAAALEQATHLAPFDRALTELYGRALLDAREALQAAVYLRRRRAAEQLRLTVANLESSIRQCLAHDSCQ